MPQDIPLILAIDSALGPASVALIHGEEALAFESENRPKMQARSLLPMVESCLKQAGVSPADIRQLACTVGPGTFTGLRIGLAAARAFAYARSVPLSGVTSLAVTAMAAKEHTQGKELLVALRAGKGEAYLQRFATAPHLSGISEASVGVLQETKHNGLVAGNHELATPVEADARHTGLIASLYPALTVAPEPFYIRPPDAKLPASA